VSPTINPVSGGGGGGGAGTGFSIATFSLTAAQLKATSQTPVTVIAAPGANKLLLPVAGTIVYTFVTTAYANVPLPISIYDETQTISGPTVLLNQTANTVVGIGAFYNPFDQFSRTNFVNAPLLISAPALGGPILTSSLNAGGAGYAINDTGTVDDNSGHASGATYRVNTVDGGGGVLTYTITAAGTAYERSTLGGPCGTTPGGGQPGVGAGFTINVLTVGPSTDAGDGTLSGTIYYLTVAV
jgi:hypothetical protein